MLGLLLVVKQPLPDIQSLINASSIWLDKYFLYCESFVIFCHHIYDCDFYFILHSFIKPLLITKFLVLVSHITAYFCDFFIFLFFISVSYYK